MEKLHDDDRKKMKWKLIKTKLSSPEVEMWNGARSSHVRGDPNVASQFYLRLRVPNG